MLGVETAHLFDEAHEWLQGLVFGREDDGGVNSGSGEVASEYLKDLFADVERDVFLGFDG